MKTIRSIFLFGFVVLGSSAWANSSPCDYYLPVCADKFARYNEEAKQITIDAQAKRITDEQAGKRIVALAQSMYPEDSLLASITAQQAALAEVLSRSNMSAKDKTALEDAAARTFSQALEFRKVLVNVAIAQEQALVGRASSQAAQVSAAQTESAVNTASMAYLLNGIGKAFSNSFGQSITPPPRICSYYGNTSFCY